MKKIFLLTAVLLFTASVQIFAQVDKNLKIDQKKVKINPKTLFDAKKIGKAVSGISDIGIKGADVYWNDRGNNYGFELDIDPILTKNSKTAKIYVKNDKGDYAGAFQLRVEALDANGKVVEKQERDLLGWTVEDTEAQPIDFRFFEDTWKKTVNFRISVDPNNLLKEANTKNNFVIIKPTKFTGKEYSTTVYPEAEK